MYNLIVTLLKIKYAGEPPKMLPEKFNYRAIFDLKEMLDKENIESKMYPLYDGYQLYINEHIDVVQNFLSRGAERDLLEICGGLTFEESEETYFVGNLTVNEAFERIRYCVRTGCRYYYAPQSEAI